MPTTKTKQLELQGALTLSEIDALRSEIDALRSEITDLNLENAELKADNAALKIQVHDLTDPAKEADVAAFKKARGYK